MDDQEFAAALAAQVASSEETPAFEEPDTPVEDTVEETPVETDEPEEAVEDPEPDPEPDLQHPLLEKYGGDVAKALAALEAAQSKIGEQGSELAEYRRMVEQLIVNQQPQQAPMLGGFETQIDENPGQVAQWALQNNQPAVYEQAMEAWFEQSPRQAAKFESALQFEAMRAMQTEQIAPDLEAVRLMQQQQAVASATRSLTQKYPDFEEVVSTATPAELEGLDTDTVRQLYTQNPAQALELVYRWVAPTRQAVTTAERQQADVQRADEARAAKKAATVVTGATTPSREEPTALDKLKEFMLTPDAHDVRNSLTQ